MRNRRGTSDAPGEPWPIKPDVTASSDPASLGRFLGGADHPFGDVALARSEGAVHLRSTDGWEGVTWSGRYPDGLPVHCVFVDDGGRGDRVDTYRELVTALVASTDHPVVHVCVDGEYLDRIGGVASFLHTLAPTVIEEGDWDMVLVAREGFGATAAACVVEVPSSVRGFEPMTGFTVTDLAIPTGPDSLRLIDDGTSSGTVSVETYDGVWSNVRYDGHTHPTSVALALAAHVVSASVRFVGGPIGPLPTLVRAFARVYASGGTPSHRGWTEGLPTVRAMAGRIDMVVPNRSTVFPVDVPSVVVDAVVGPTSPGTVVAMSPSGTVVQSLRTWEMSEDGASVRLRVRYEVLHGTVDATGVGEQASLLTGILRSDVDWLSSIVEETSGRTSRVVVETAPMDPVGGGGAGVFLVEAMERTAAVLSTSVEQTDMDRGVLPN